MSWVVILVYRGTGKILAFKAALNVPVVHSYFNLCHLRILLIKITINIKISELSIKILMLDDFMGATQDTSYTFVNLQLRIIAADG